MEAADSTKTYRGVPIWKTPSALHSVDWQNALYRQSLTQSYSVGIRGGNDKMQSAISFGYYNQKGIVLGSYFKRFTVGLNLDYQPTKRFEEGLEETIEFFKQVYSNGPSHQRRIRRESQD